MKFRKRAIVVDAMQVFISDWDALVTFCGGRLHRILGINGECGMLSGVGSDATVCEGDWITKDEATGFLFAYRPEDFAALFERAVRVMPEAVELSPSDVHQLFDLTML